MAFVYAIGNIYGNFGFLKNKCCDDMEFLHDVICLQLRKSFSETKIQKLLANYNSDHER